MIDGANAAQMLENHKAMRAKLMQADDVQNFSYDLEAGLTEDERKANQK